MPRPTHLVPTGPNRGAPSLIDEFVRRDAHSTSASAWSGTYVYISSDGLT